MAFRNAQDYLEVEHPRLFSYVDIYPSAPEDLDLVVAGQWYNPTGIWAEFLGANFTLTPTGGYVTLDGPDAIFNYIAHLIVSADKACSITTGTFVNEILTTQTTLKIGAAETDKRMLRTRLLSLSTDDILHLRVKSDTANTTVSLSEGRITIK